MEGPAAGGGGHGLGTIGALPCLCLRSRAPLSSAAFSSRPGKQPALSEGPPTESEDDDARERPDACTSCTTYSTHHRSWRTVVKVAPTLVQKM